MAEQYEEPWRAAGRLPWWILNADGNEVAMADGRQGREIQVANAARIVACVNALADIPTEVLPAIGRLIEAAEACVASDDSGQSRWKRGEAYQALADALKSLRPTRKNDAEH